MEHSSLMPEPGRVPGGAAADGDRGGVFTDTAGFAAMDAAVPGLSGVILRKLNLSGFDDYRMALQGKKSLTEFGIHTYRDMFRKIEDTYTFCAHCKKLPDGLPAGRTLARCKRCQNVYYCGTECQRANWPLHKKFCKKLKHAAIDRLVEWLIFTGNLPFTSGAWPREADEVRGWDDWLSMQPGSGEDALRAVLACRYMGLLWANAGKPRPDDAELLASTRRVLSDALSRPLTVGFALRRFGLDPRHGPVTVHVAGASHTETLDTRLTDYDELGCMFPQHRGVEVVMIGPEVVEGTMTRTPLQAGAEPGTVYMSGWKGLYHDYWETLVETGRAARPSLVVSFHPGFHANKGLVEGWFPTLLLLRDYNIPSFFTMYSEAELKPSLQILRELEVRVLSHGSNPFGALRLEQVQSNPNKPLVRSNATYVAFLGAVDDPEEGPGPDCDLSDAIVPLD
uniref:MYND-type domain-containing protein n=2 Tax=Petromyzon marinus TaxID=7757 RepID=A0AAJ7X0C0_PETMA|nr:putative protein MSS51 homolog, mitochondrial isoform X2 [Petromyzon marinus]